MLEVLRIYLVSFPRGDVVIAASATSDCLSLPRIQGIPITN
jgi:hypothetical protein